MKRYAIISMILFSLILSVFAVADCGSHDQTYREGYLLIRFNEQGTSSEADTARQAILDSAGGGTIERNYKMLRGLALVKLPDGMDSETAAPLYESAAGIQYAVLDKKGCMDAIPDDPDFSLLWGMNNTGQTGGTNNADIDAPEAWDLETGSSEIVVAVCDTGVDYTHPDLADNIWVNEAELNGEDGIDDDGNGYVDDVYGWDPTDGDGYPMDTHGHGTHVAGTIGAVGNNGVGVVGVNWNVKIMPIRIESFFDSAIVEGMEYAISNGAHVMNHSWGGYAGASQAIIDIFNLAEQSGVICACSAGNNSVDTDPLVGYRYPSALPNTNIIVAVSTDQFDQRSSFSNWGADTTDIGAPGSDIYSTQPGGGYQSMSGTSMASPHVAGACALVWSVNPLMPFSEVKDHLLFNVDKLGAMQGLCVSEGRLNLARSVQGAIDAMADILPPIPTQMQWEDEPTAVGLQTIYMKAGVATDESGVEFFFDCINDDTYDSDWQDSRTYYRGDYQEGGTYEFQVKARDKSENLNETEYSEAVAATLASGSDNLKPYPDPTEWKGIPARVPNMIRIVMQAEAYDELGGAPLQYYYDCVATNDPAFPDPNGLDSGWTTNSLYQRSDITGADNNSYTFRARVQDAAGNMTDWSAEASVVFAPSPTIRVVNPVGGYGTIQAAIDACNQGDTVVVPPGTYTGPGNINLNFNIPAAAVGGGNLLNITVRGGNPDDPSDVIIECGGVMSDGTSNFFPVNPARGFIFQNSEGSGVIIEGFTIQNGLAVDRPLDVDTLSPFGANANGGAIFASTAASPVIRRCFFSNCHAIGQNGGLGLDGTDPANPNFPMAGNGASGGNGFGGAMYFAAGSQPLIENCQINNCTAVGGDGGNGGLGADVDANNGILAPTPGGNGGFAGIASGGAMYFEPGCQPQLDAVSISDCQARVGQIASGGNGGNGDAAQAIPGANGGNTGDLNGTFIHGGAIFFDTGSTVTMNNCFMTDCTLLPLQTSVYTFGTGGAGAPAGMDGVDISLVGNLSILVSYGGANFYGANSTATLNNVTIQGNTSILNQGGGEFYDTQCTTSHQGCSIRENDSPIVQPPVGAGSLGGGGLYLTDPVSAVFTDCTVSFNTAMSGAGIYIDGQTTGTYSLTNCQFNGNDSNVNNLTSFGGAVYAGSVAIANGLTAAPASPPFTMTVANCQFGTNVSPYGGGLCVDGANLTVTESTFTDNSAEYGGGVFAYGGQVTLADCMFDENLATITLPVNDATSGAAAYLQQSDVSIVDTVFMSNTSDDAAGALAVVGAPLLNSFQMITNCLFIDNTAGFEGGALTAEYSAMLTIENCTFADNTVTDDFGLGGGIACYENTFVDIWDSIFWNNRAAFGPQILLGDPFGDYIYIQPSMVFVDYSDVEGGEDGIDDSADVSEWAWFSDNSIQDDPLFAVTEAGFSLNNYYLSQDPGGQVANSPCVNRGSITAVAVGLDTYTTRTDNLADANEVDMGYHYDVSLPVPVYTLETGVLIVDLLPHGRLEVTTEPNNLIPNSDPPLYRFKQGTVVQLLAIPDEFYRVARWMGSDNDLNYFEEDNTITMIGNELVQVEFELDVPRNLYVPESYDTIEDAVLAARSGDRIVLSPRPSSPYLISDPDGINFGMDVDGNPINLVITSADPNNPQVVADTIIDCQGSRYTSKRAFHFFDGQTNDSKIEGITIRNAFTAVIGLSEFLPTGPWPWPFPSPPTPLPPDRGLSGLDATGDSYGGAILLENGSSPVIRNCVFENCTVSGGIGGDGEDGQYPSGMQNVTADLDSQSGGHSGKGTGDGYGGAIAVRSGSNPRILNCTFNNNRATGGWGGIPGNAGTSYNNGRYGWGGNDFSGLFYANFYFGVSLEAGYGEGDGHGGAIFVEANCDPDIIQCTFEGNYARPGYVSPGGSEGEGNAYPDPWDADPWDSAAGVRDGRDGILITGDLIAGGAFFFEQRANITLEGCQFIKNEAYVVSSYDGDPYDPPISTRGGAVYSDPNTILTILPMRHKNDPDRILSESVFSGNIAGALYCGEGVELSVEQTQFINNLSYYPEEEETTIFEEFFYAELPDIIELLGNYDIAGAITVEINAATTSQITNCQFTGNTSRVGGGAVRTDSDMDFIDCVLNGNMSLDNGGAVYSYVSTHVPETHTTKISFDNCELSGNDAQGYGGAVFVKSCLLTMNETFLVFNKAFSGGAVRVSSQQGSAGDLFMKDCLVFGNEATGVILGSHRTVVEEGFGGGVHVADAPFSIMSTRFQNNSVRGIISEGGGLCVTGSQIYYQQDLLNCLFANNHSDNKGGGVSCHLYVQPEFNNCTFANNTCGNDAIESEGKGGALYLDQLSYPKMYNSIVSGNQAFGVYEKPYGSLTVTDTLFFGNEFGDIFDRPAPADNFSGDPLYAAGPLGEYYLTQASSPAWNAGNIAAATIGLDDLTTSPDETPDSGVVDLGYHYEDSTGLEQFYLTVCYVDDTDTIIDAGTITITKADNGQQEVSVSEPLARGKILTVTANVNGDYFLTGWSGGTINDGSMELENTVLMTRDKSIKVHVRKRRTLNVGISAEYDTLGDAIVAAQDGDTILVFPGEYIAASQHASSANNFILSDKKITITGTNPDSEDVVRSTVFRDFDFWLTDLDDETVIEGISLNQSHMELLNSDIIIRNCVFSECRFAIGLVPHSDPPAGTDGYHANPIYGGAIAIWDSSPKIINCIFEDNWVIGHDGENGFAGAESHPTGGDGGWPSPTYGGAVYCGLSSDAEFIHCTFTGNEVFGANGGNGGNGWVNPSGHVFDGGRGGGWLYDDDIEEYLILVADDEWDGWAFNSPGNKYGLDSIYSYFYGQYDLDVWAWWFNWGDSYTTWDQFFADYFNDSLDPLGDPYDQMLDVWRHSGYGGAIYCELDSDVTFKDCVFENNQSHGGLTGIGGLIDAQTSRPDRQLNMPTAGGAVYAAHDSDLTFVNCSFSGNVADKSTVDLPHTYQVSFGGAVAYEFNCNVVFTECEFHDNDATVGGGVYGRESSSQITDCNAVDNEAYMGAGIYLEHGSAVVDDVILQANLARTPAVTVIPPADPDDPPIPVPTLDSTGIGAGLMAVSVDMEMKDAVFVNNAADLSGGGLSLAGTVPETTTVFNCLFAGNSASRDGGGASVNWSSRADFGNCTFADNYSLGSEALGSGSGAGLYCAYDSIVEVIDSIFWGNSSQQGAQITVGTGFEFDPRPSELTITYSDIAGFPGANAIYVGPGCTLNPPYKIINQDPEFVSALLPADDGTSSNYYLAQAQYPMPSPCLDFGSDFAFDLGLSNYTTSINSARDKGKVDLGYHYNLAARYQCGTIDEALSYDPGNPMDGEINLADLTRFLEQWLNVVYPSCSEGNLWCDGSDLNYDGEVNLDDMLGISSCWLAADTEPPVPNPLTWNIAPRAVVGTFDEIEMEVVFAHDAWWPDEDVKYQFKFGELPDPNVFYVDQDVNQDGWMTYDELDDLSKNPEDIVVRIHATASNLIPGEALSLYVLAEDGSGNQTALSEKLAGTVVPGDATELPAAVWEAEPFNTVLNPGPDAEIAIEMEVVAYDLLPDKPALPPGYVIKYLFAKDEVPLGAYQESTIFTDTDIELGQVLTYRARMGLFYGTDTTPIVESDWTPLGEITVVGADLEPPIPSENQDPLYPFKAQHASTPASVQIGSIWYQIVTAVPAIDLAGVEYKFVCSNNDFSSGGSLDSGPEWRNDANVGLGTANPTYPDGSVQIPTTYVVDTNNQMPDLVWYIFYRDLSPNQNMGDSSDGWSQNGPNPVVEVIPTP